MVAEAYAGIDFPFPEVQTTALPMALIWSVEHLLAYVGTWSAVARYREQCGRDPLVDFAVAVRAAWVMRASRVGPRRRRTPRRRRLG